MRFSEEKVTWSNDKSPWNCCNPVGISLFEVNSRNTKAICGIWSKLTSHLLLMLLLLTLTRYMPAGTKIMIIVMALAMMNLLTDLTSELIQFFFFKKIGGQRPSREGRGLRSEGQGNPRPKYYKHNGWMYRLKKVLLASIDGVILTDQGLNCSAITIMTTKNCPCNHQRTSKWCPSN